MWFCDYLLAFKPLLSKAVNRLPRIYNKKIKSPLWVFCLPHTLPMTHLESCLTLTGRPCTVIQHLDELWSHIYSSVLLLHNFLSFYHSIILSIVMHSRPFSFCRWLNGHYSTFLSLSLSQCSSNKSMHSCYIFKQLRKILPNINKAILRKLLCPDLLHI